MGIFDIFRSKKRKIRKSKKGFKRIPREYAFITATYLNDYKLMTLTPYSEGDSLSHDMFQYVLKRLHSRHEKERFSVCKTKGLVMYVYAFYDGRYDRMHRPTESFLICKLTPEMSETYGLQDFIFDVHQTKACLNGPMPTGFDLANMFNVTWDKTKDKESFDEEFLKNVPNAFAPAAFDSEDLKQNKQWQMSTMGNDCVVLNIPNFKPSESEPNI